MKILHNPRCRKSRETLDLIQKSGTYVKIIPYLDGILSKEELVEILEKLSLNPSQIIRKGESIFKERFKGENFSEDEWLDILVQNPKLIERPIVIIGDKAIIGRPPENVLPLLK